MNLQIIGHIQKKKVYPNRAERNMCSYRGIKGASVLSSVGEKPKTGPAAKIGPAKFWLGQFFPNFGWAKT